MPFGLGRSYGDVCLNDGGTLLDTRGLKHFISFDPRTGILDCEAGLALSELMDVLLPKGWFPPVVPGTKHVTIGGAIANDIHGKNHHRAGTFGCHVLGFELLRSSGERLFCSPEKNTDFFRATIGGLGLTGLILWARIQLKRTSSLWIDSEHLAFMDLNGFFELSRDSDESFEYTVAWVDCVSGGGKAGRGIFIRGNTTEDYVQDIKKRKTAATLRVPFDVPSCLLNSSTMGIMNEGYFRLQSAKKMKSRMHYDSFFFPLDCVEDWNRLYGRAGFIQYQFVLPEGAEKAMAEVFNQITRSGLGSFLAVLKRFGSRPSPGMLSFPKQGITLALDFPNSGRQVFELLRSLDDIVAASGGSVYPAKDARMSAESFRKFFPQWEAFSQYIDPNFSSDFWKRVMTG